MKRNYGYIYLFLAVILLNMPGSVGNYRAWEKTIAPLSYHALSSAVHLPHQETSLSALAGKALLEPAFSMLGYRQDSPAENMVSADKGDEEDSGNIYSPPASSSSPLHSGSPKVLIYHTHTTESYLTKEGEKPSSWRSTDEQKNLIAVGNIVSRILHDEYGIQVLHITDILDQPYNSAYDKSYDVAKAAVEKYPSIEYIFDMHRDGLSDNESNRQVYLTEINGQKCARIMFVMSTKSKYIDEMRAFGGTLQKKMNELYPGLFRRNMDRPYKYNLEFRPNSMLFEVGSNLTTIAEAKCAAVYLGRSLGEVITQK